MPCPTQWNSTRAMTGEGTLNDSNRPEPFAEPGGLNVLAMRLPARS